MKRVVKFLLFVWLISMIILACSKDNSIGQSELDRQAEILSVGPNPIPVDTLMLDTLMRDPYR